MDPRPSCKLSSCSTPDPFQAGAVLCGPQPFRANAGGDDRKGLPLTIRNGASLFSVLAGVSVYIVDPVCGLPSPLHLNM